MAEPTPLRRGAGDNQPPSDSQLLRDALAAKYPELMRRFVELEAACGSVPAAVDNDADAKKIVDFVAQQIRPLQTQAKAAHRAEKAPHLELSRVVDDFFLRRLEKLALAVAVVEARAAAYYERQKKAQREAERIARQKAAAAAAKAHAEAERLRAQAALRSAAGDTGGAVALATEAESTSERAWDLDRAAAAPPQPVRILGDYGATGFAKTRWVFEIDDLDKLPAGFWMPDFDAIQSFIDERIAAAGTPPEIPGVRIFESDRFLIRRC